MKQLRLSFLGLVAFMFGCQQVELSESNELGGVSLKTVTISADMSNDETKASLDSNTGAFSWQSGDLISVLATDGNFYDFILTAGSGKRRAEFEGNIPETASITTVATYPRIVANGAVNTVLVGSTLNYALPDSWTYSPNVSNVPMVATFGEGAEDMNFKQVGGVIRFPVKNLPKQAKFVVAMEDKTITGSFPVDITNLGETVMTAGTQPSTLTINYSSDVDGASAEFNVPVPAGVYNKFTVTIKDSNDNELFSKNYTAENTVNRRTLLIMKEVTLPERPLAPEVWPYFVDARVAVEKAEGVSQYAVYVDGASEPVIKDVEEVSGKATVVFGGDFTHNSTHTVAIAKVVNDVVVPESKSETIEFKTADIRQLTNNTGTKFVAVGWDDVTIEDAPVWDSVNKRYSAVEFITNQDKRGYQVQLFAADKTTVLYDLIPFDSHNWFEGAFCSDVNFGKINGVGIASPTALTFSWLEPGKDYYFRVKALDDIVYLDNENGNYNPDGTSDVTKPVPYPLCSERGGSAWSELVKLSTDPVHVPSLNEIFYEGFDEILVHEDVMNWSHVVVPDFSDNYTSMSQADYLATLADGYKTFLKSDSKYDYKFYVQQFMSDHRAYAYGMYDGDFKSNEVRLLNETAGLKGWGTTSSRNKQGDCLQTAVGVAKLGRGRNYKDASPLYTPQIISDRLSEDYGTKCVITVNATNCVAAVSPTDMIKSLKVQVKRGEMLADAATAEFEVANPELFNNSYIFTDTNNYTNWYNFYELKFELYMRNGDQLIFSRAVANEKGFLVIGDIKIEVVPGVYDSDLVNPEDTGIGTQPDDTNYDVYGLGEFPISYWWTPPTAAHNYDDAETRRLYQELQESGMNIVLYNGELDYTLAENVRIMNIAGDLGMKFIGSLQGYTSNEERIAAIKEHLAPSATYVGEYLTDEPGASMFDELGEFARAYFQEIPNKEVYVNLFPSYAANRLETSTYQEHIEQYLSKVNTKSVSFDYYGFTSSGLKTSYFQDLDIVRHSTLSERKPFWAITQAGKVGNQTRYVTEKEQRWTVWSNIAMGSKGIQYFCYWNAWHNTDEGYDTALMNRDGTKRDMYYWVQKINQDINTIGKKLLPCHADGAILGSTVNYPCLINNGSGRTKYGPIKSAVGSKSILVGCFRDARISENGDNYKGYKALVMSQQPGRTIDATITLVNSITNLTITHNNTSSVVELTNTLNTTVGGISVAFDGGNLILNIPEGEAVLLEF